jgi:hypothetical protein
MTISDALPIQFWYNGIPTYNEYDPGVPFDHVLFYQEFLNTDDVRIQLRDTTGLTYNLQFLDCDGVETNLLPFTEISSAVYEITFNPADLGINNHKVQFKIQKGEIIGSITTETQISIDEFASDMDGWVNETTALHPIQDPDDAQQRDSGHSWFINPTFFDTLGEMFSKYAYIELNGSNADIYNIHIEIEVLILDSPTVNWSAVIVFFDSSFATLGTTGFSEPAFAAGTKSFDFTVPSGIGNVKYIGLRIFDDTVNPGTYEGTFIWTVASIIPPDESDWAWSADDSGCMKVTTIATTDTSIVSKVFTFPQENHYIRMKWQIVYPPVNSNFTLIVKILDSSGGVLLVQLLTSPSNSSEQTFIQFITSSIYLTASKVRIDLHDSSGTFLAGDIAKVNSVEFYTSITEYVTSFTEVAKSDYVKFSPTIEDVIYIQYKSLKNFAGIYYTSLSPYFSIRIPAIFQIETPITEQKGIDLSNSRVINTASQLKIQKELLILECPDYIHKKIILILQHAVSGSIVINNVEWTIEEEYKKERADPMFIFSRGSTQLTRRNYLQGNVI